MVQEFEQRIAEYLGVKHCVAMCNGTIALEIDSKFDSATAATPFNQGWLTAQDGLGAQIATCVPGGANDPVPTILIKY